MVAQSPKNYPIRRSRFLAPIGALYFFVNRKRKDALKQQFKGSTKKAKVRMLLATYQFDDRPLVPDLVVIGVGLCICMEITTRLGGCEWN